MQSTLLGEKPESATRNDAPEFANSFTHFLVASDISYGVYLYGWPTQKLLLWYFPRLTLGTQILLAVGLSMVLGSLSWNLIEKRCLAWKPRLLK